MVPYALHEGDPLSLFRINEFSAREEMTSKEKDFSRIWLISTCSLTNITCSLSTHQIVQRLKQRSSKINKSFLVLMQLFHNLKRLSFWKNVKL